MERRGFFTFGLKQAMKAVTTLVENKVARSVRWIRPPFAVAEMDFLLRCDRCDLCIKACPHGVIFKLSLEDGPQAAGTPALDLVHRGCHLCEDWPCVTVCEPKALQMPTESTRFPPRFATIRIQSALCLPFSGPECRACDSVCPLPGALLWDNGRRPRIDPQLCVGCALCREACIVHPQAIHVGYLALHAQGDIDDAREGSTT